MTRTSQSSDTNARLKTDALDFHNQVETAQGPPFKLTKNEVILLGIAGVGFFLDAYDLLIINPVSTMLQYRLYGGGKLPPRLEGFIKASANIGAVIGQFLFGYLADSLGRKTVYGKELMLVILATILTLTTPTGSLSPDSCLIYLGIFRILLGVGVGGDYPMSATVTSDRANIRKRGTMLAYTFASQSWGNFAGSLVTIVVLAAYKNTMEAGHVSKIDGVWRIIVGVSLVPAFGTLYQRLTLPESTRYENAQNTNNDGLTSEKSGGVVTVKGESEATGDTLEVVRKKAHFQEFISYFSQWEHLKILVGTSMCWLLLDIVFYGINLNQNVVLQQIGYDGTSGSPWTRLFKVSTGGIIIAALGFVPGYYATVLTIEYLGRKWLQLQGFLLAALMFAILAARFHELGSASFIACFALLQFFLNFGANPMTYCYPAEVFPTKYRAFAHGISAASGKVGAIITALAFNSLSQEIGTPNVLWIFFACCLLGAMFTLLLPEVKGRDPDLILAQEMAREI